MRILSSISLAAGNTIRAKLRSQKSQDGTLAAAQACQQFTVQKIAESCEENLAHRLDALGFRKDMTITCIRRAPLGSPIMFRVCDTDICLRAHQAQFIYAALHGSEVSSS